MGDRILLDNAYEAWMSAIQYGWALYNGVTTLGYKKSFVASLHNSVELFIKQMMLDDNDHRVATVKKVKNKDGEPLKSFLNSMDLNEYFGKLTQEARECFYSIEFGELKSICCKLMESRYDNPEDALKLLQRLRNNETHFYIAREDYLNDQEYVILHNFMVDFCKFIDSKNLFPDSFEGRSFGPTEMGFWNEKLTEFSFLSKLTSSLVAVWVKEMFAKRGGMVSGPVNNALFLIDELWEDARVMGYSYDWLMPFLASIFENELIEFEDAENEIIETSGGRLYSRERHKLIFKY